MSAYSPTFLEHSLAHMLTTGTAMDDKLVDYNKGVSAVIEVRDQMEIVWSKVNQMFYNASQYIKFISTLMMLICGFTFVVVFGSLITFCFRMNEKCKFMGIVTKLCIALLGLYSFIIAAVLLVMVVINFSFSGLCEFAYTSSVKPDLFVDVSSTVPTALTGMFAKECFSTGRNMTDYITLDAGVKGNWESINTFIGGYSEYDNFLTQLNPDMNLNTIASTSDFWKLYKTGVIYNFDNVASELELLNTDVKSCTEAWVLNSQNCTSVTTQLKCSSISTTSTFDKNRTCLTAELKETSLSRFDNLKNYLQGQNIMMADLILKLNEMAGTTPRKEYDNMRKKFDEFKTSFKSVRTSLDKTFTPMSNFKRGFYELTDCKVLKREMLIANAGVCYTFRPKAYDLFFYLMLCKNWNFKFD